MSQPHEQWKPRDTPLGPPAAPVPPPPNSAYYMPPQYWPPAPPPPRRRPVGLIIALSMLGLSIIVSAALFATAAVMRRTPATVTVSGSLVLSSTDGIENVGSTHCRGVNGYGDIDQGAQVTVTDEKGTVIGVGELDQGTASGFGRCVFAFTIPKIPGGHTFYGVSVSHRGTIQIQPAELTNVRISLG